MSRILLAEFLRRVQEAGVDLTGCGIRNSDMKEPHVLNSLEVVHGKPSVKVITAGFNTTANLISSLVVTSIYMGGGNHRLTGGRRKLNVVFAYA